MTEKTSTNSMFKSSGIKQQCRSYMAIGDLIHYYIMLDNANKHQNLSFSTIVDLDISIVKIVV